MSYTPRHLRKRYKRLGAVKDKDKQRAFKRAAAYSKLFMNQSASQLEGNLPYLKYCAKVGDGSKGLRTGK